MIRTFSFAKPALTRLASSDTLSDDVKLHVRAAVRVEGFNALVRCSTSASTGVDEALAATIIASAPAWAYAYAIEAPIPREAPMMQTT
jgi:hypothetical protein